MLGKIMKSLVLVGIGMAAGVVAGFNSGIIATVWVEFKDPDKAQERLDKLKKLHEEAEEEKKNG